MGIQIAIDGPAGAGKSTIAKIISKELGYIYLDTGAMYRSFALYAINHGVDCTDSQALIGILDGFNLEIVYDKCMQQLIVNGENVTKLIRTAEVSTAASLVAVVKEVRIKMVDIQRQIANGMNVVMDGRDIGTYVLPAANIKIFLTASLDERAKRRYLEMKDKSNNKLSIDDVRKDMEFRDNNDSSRSFAPLIKASDAIEVDTTGLDLNETIENIRNLIRSRNLYV